MRLLPVLLPGLLLVACEGDDDVTPTDTDGDPIAEAAAPGPFAVGHVTTEITYTAVTTDADRTLPVEVWYPAPAGSAAAPAVYVVAGFAQVPSTVALDGPPISDAGPFPVAVYSHGSGGVGALAYPYAERLASHGWIVLAADHVGNTVFELLGDDTSPFVALLVDRPADVRAELDAASELPVLAGQADADQAYVFGHSFGGYTTLAIGGPAIDVAAFDAACATADESDPDCLLFAQPDVRDALGHLGDPRVDAIAPQAPAVVSGFVQADLAALDTPMLLMSGARDQTTPDDEEARPLWTAAGKGDDLWLHLPDAGHYTFISICDDLGADLIAQFQPGAEQDGCGPDFVPTARVIPAMSTYLLAFGEVHVRGHQRFQAVLDADPLDAGIELVRP